jgi:glycosyltransferase involved in cell wall biosynthesis
MTGQSMRILLSAYACKPGYGSESGGGWGWATHLAARGLHVHVLTMPCGRDQIEAEQRSNPIPNLTFSFIDPEVRNLAEGRGAHYFAWHFAALKVARTLHAQRPFDVVHHVSYGSIHVPTQLWRLGVPVVFGPVGGGQTSPLRMLSYFGRSAGKELFRTVFTKALPLSLLHHWWFRHLTYVFATNHETLALAKNLSAPNVQLGLDAGLPKEFFADGPRQFVQNAGPVRLLWTGRMMPRKALPLTLDGLMNTTANVKLTILGDGLPAEDVQRMIRVRGLEDKVVWSGGRVPWDQVKQAYRTHDAFGSQHLEAMASGLPIITLNLHGARTFVPLDAGYKVPVTNKPSTILAIAQAIDSFASSSIAERNRMSRTAWEAALPFSWNMRAERAERLYAYVRARHSLDGETRSLMPGSSQFFEVDPI